MESDGSASVNPLPQSILLSQGDLVGVTRVCPTYAKFAAAGVFNS